MARQHGQADRPQRHRGVEGPGRRAREGAEGPGEGGGAAAQAAAVRRGSRGEAAARGVQQTVGVSGRSVQRGTAADAPAYEPSSSICIFLFLKLFKCVV